jgi:putative endonuclease
MTRPRGPARSDDRTRLGRLGEEAAARHLAARGYRIVARNVRADRVELDLIARHGAWLVFVEVKSRRAARHGQAAEAVDPRKQRRLRHGAAAWLASRPPEARGVQRHRFDVVTCVLLPTGERHAEAPDETSAPEAARWSIEHWEAAF